MHWLCRQHGSTVSADSSHFVTHLLCCRIVKQEVGHTQRVSPERAEHHKMNGLAEPKPVDILELLSKAKEEYHRVRKIIWKIFFPATEKIDSLIEWLTLFINWTSVWTLVMHVWGYSGPPTRIISTVCVSVYYIIHLYSSLYFGGKKNMAFFMFVVQAQACETDVRAEVSMPAPVTAAEHTRKKTRQDKVRKPAFKKQPLSRTKEKAPCGSICCHTV